MTEQKYIITNRDKTKFISARADFEKGINEPLWTDNLELAYLFDSEAAASDATDKVPALRALLEHELNDIIPFPGTATHISKKPLKDRITVEIDDYDDSHLAEVFYDHTNAQDYSGYIIKDSRRGGLPNELEVQWNEDTPDEDWTIIEDAIIDKYYEEKKRLAAERRSVAQKAMKELKALIKVFIENCDPAVTPNICRMSADREGYRMIEKSIITKVKRSGIPVGSAMAELDNELQRAYE